METGYVVKSGRYRLMTRLGGGNVSETWRASDETSGAEVGLKRFSLRAADHWKQVELAEREARVLQSIEHELLPRYVDHFEEDGALHTVMTLVAGEDLRALCRRGERFSTRDVLQLLGDAAASFEYLHG